MILGAKARYAVMAMVDLAARGAQKPITLAELAVAQDIPLPYLEQIFAMLRRAGLVKSVRGPGGGYTLANPANKMNVADIIIAVDEPIKMTRCGVEEQAGGCLASKARCRTHELWEGLGNQIYDYLHGMTLADVLAPGQRQEACQGSKKTLMN